MSDLSKYPDEIWDRFFEFSFGCSESLGRAEVQEKLKQLGVDLAKARTKVQQALETVGAREELAAARERRPGLVAAAKAVTVRVGESFREKLRKMVEQKFQGSAQAAYYRKLDAAASAQDLQSLLEDMQRLEAMETEKGHGEPESK